MRTVLILAAGLLIGVAVSAWWWLPRAWPDLVVAQSPFLGPAIRAEAARDAGAGRGPLRLDYVALWSRISADQPAARRALLAALDDADPAVRRVALRHLENHPWQQPLDDADRQRIAGLAGDGDAQVRAAVLRCLAGDPAHAAALRAGLADPAAPVRLAAVRGLEPLRDASLLPIFAAMLHDPVDGVAAAAMSALGALRRVEAAEPLLAALAANRPGAVGAAGRALAGLPLDAAQRQRRLDLLAAALREDGVRWSAIQASYQLADAGLAAAGEALHAALDDRDLQARQFAADLLRDLGAPPSPRLVAVTVEGLRDDDWPDGPRAYCPGLANAKSGTRWLWLHPEAGEPELRAALAGDDAQQRFLAAWLLAMRERSELAEALCRELAPRLAEPAGKPAALWAIQALFRLGPSALPHLLPLLPAADRRQAACIRLLERDWRDPPRDRYEAARRGRLALSPLYHDPAWEPALAAPGRLPEPFPVGLR